MNVTVRNSQLHNAQHAIGDVETATTKAAKSPSAEYTVSQHTAEMEAAGCGYVWQESGIYFPMLDVDTDAMIEARSKADEAGITTKDIWEVLHPGKFTGNGWYSHKNDCGTCSIWHISQWETGVEAKFAATVWPGPSIDHPEATWMNRAEVEKFIHERVECDPAASIIAELTASTETNSVEQDPIRDAIQVFLNGLQAYNDYSPADDEVDEVAERTYVPPMYVIEDWEGPALTKQGAIDALQLALDEMGNFAAQDTVPPMVRAALGYLKAS